MEGQDFIKQIKDILLFEYSQQEVDDMIDAAKIYEDELSIAVTYDNGVVDIFNKKQKMYLVLRES